MSKTEVVETDQPQKVDKSDPLTNPPEGWTVTAVPNLATLTIEYRAVSSGDHNEVFRTNDKGAVLGHIQDIEDGWKGKNQPQPTHAIGTADAESFGING